MLKQKTPKPERRVIKARVLPGWLHPDTSAAVRAVLRQQKLSTWTVRFSKGERAVCRRRPPVPVSRWAEHHRVLHLSSRPGRWRNAVTQYTSGIMDASFFPSVRTIVTIKCPQSGGTEAVHNCVGYAIDRAPGPVLYVYPDESTARENALDRIIPMLRASRRLSEYVTGTTDDLSSLRINLAHMTLHMAWSGSASRLGNKPIRYLVLDELDKYQQIKKEATSEALAEKRVTTWGKRARIWKISTPTVVNGPIDVAFKTAEARYRYFVICPHCGAELLMEFERICWPEGVDPVTLQSRQLAWYACQHCEAHWTDADRDKAVRMGLWREEVSGMALAEHLETATPMSVGFHIAAWISPFVSLSEVAAKALIWQNTQDMNVYKDLQNNYKAEPWEEQYEVRTEDAILALCDDRPRGVLPGPLPDGTPRIACLLAGVDTQLRYYRYVIRAFGFGGELESWLVQEGVAPTLEALDQLFWHNEYRDATGTPFKVSACMIDAMGHPERTSGVYGWAAVNRGRVFPSQGVHAPSTPVGFAPREYFVDAKGHKVVIPGGVLLCKVDTTLFKGELANALTIAPTDPGAFHLHSMDEGSASGTLTAYAKEMTAEVWNSERGLWDNPSKKPNHAWDCEYLLRGLAWMMGVRNMTPPNADDDGPEYIPQPSSPSSLGRSRRR